MTNDEKLEKLTDVTNRSKRQTKELLELCDGDWDKLYELENQIKLNFVFWCPADKEAVQFVLNLNSNPYSNEI